MRKFRYHYFDIKAENWKDYFEQLNTLGAESWEIITHDPYVVYDDESCVKEIHETVFCKRDVS